jgi:predicted dehydrogenase
MREILQRPEFGAPTYYEGHFFAPTPTSPGIHDSVFRAYLWDQGVHLVDCTRFLMGDIAEVRATGHEGAGGAIGLSLTLRFVSGSIGQLALVSAAPVMEHYVGVLGDGRARVQVFDQDRLEYQAMPPWTGDGGYADVPAQTWRPGASAHAMAGRMAYVEEHRHFARALLDGDQPHASLEDGYRALCVLERARGGRRQPQERPRRAGGHRLTPPCGEQGHDGGSASAHPRRPRVCGAAARPGCAGLRRGRGARCRLYTAPCCRSIRPRSPTATLPCTIQ